MLIPNSIDLEEKILNLKRKKVRKSRHDSWQTWQTLEEVDHIMLKAHPESWRKIDWGFLKGVGHVMRQRGAA